MTGDWTRAPVAFDFFQAVRPVDAVVKRYAAGTWTKGRFTPGAVAHTWTLRASVQPYDVAGNVDKIVAPEGQRIKAGIKLFFANGDEPRATDQATKTPGDRIEFEGVAYEVQKVDHPVGQDTSHWFAVAVVFEADKQ